MSASKIDNVTLKCTEDHPLNISSHDPVLASLHISSNVKVTEKEKYKHTYSAFSHSKVLWNEDDIYKYKEISSQMLTEAEALFPDPEFIPLKCELYSNLLVRAAELSCATSHKRPEKRCLVPPQVNRAWKKLQRAFKNWKQEGKPRLPSSNSYLTFKQARSNLQQIRRYQNNLKMIRTNNKLMQTHSCHRQRHFRLIKNLRTPRNKQSLSELHTQAGVYYGSDTLEGFAREAEILGSFVEESKEYDNHTRQSLHI